MREMSYVDELYIAPCVQGNLLAEEEIVPRKRQPWPVLVPWLRWDGWRYSPMRSIL